VRRLGHPATSLAAVTALIYVNQVLFTVYVLRVHHGDPSFIARYLPSGWFALDRGGAIATLARHFPAPGQLGAQLPGGRGLDSIGRSFGWFLVLFFVPALPVRYAMNFGWRDAAALVSLVVLAAACGLGARGAFAPGRPWPWLAQMAASALAGLAAAIPAALLTTGLRETRLLWAAAAFFVTAVTVCGLIDRIFQPNNQNDIAFTSD